MIETELKNVLNDMINKFVQVLNVGLFVDDVANGLKKEYDKGLMDAESQFNMNFVRDENRLQLLQKFAIGNVKDLNTSIADSLRKEITQGIINLESVNELQKRVQKVFDVSIERARTIARTETVRAQNMGHIDAARQTGLKLYKKWDAHLDSRTSKVCAYLDGKEIPIDDKFKWEDKEFDAPPAHPNCRSTLLFIQKKMED